MKLALLPNAIGALLLLGGCTVAKPAQPDKVYSGTYFYNFESSSFTPDGTSEAWCLRGNVEQAELLANGASAPSGRAHVVVRGVLSPPGHYCNLGASTHILTVSQILEVSDKRPQ